MFRASCCPSSGATTTAVAASGLLSELGDSSAVRRGRVFVLGTTGIRFTKCCESCRVSGCQ